MMVSSVTRSNRPLSSTKSHVLGRREDHIESDQFALSYTDIFGFRYVRNLNYDLSSIYLNLIFSTPKHIKHRDSMFHIFLSPERCADYIFTDFESMVELKDGTPIHNETLIARLYSEMIIAKQSAMS